MPFTDRSTDAAASGGSRVNTPEGAAVIENIDAQKKLVFLRYLQGGQTRRIPVEKFNAMFEKK